MSDESSDTSTDRTNDTVPGSGAGDAAHTTQIPRIEHEDRAKTDKGRPRPTGSTPAKKASPAKSSPEKSSPEKSSPEKSSSAKTSPVKTSPAKVKPAAQKPKSVSSGPVGRPLTASDYARTTSQSASATAVIPAVKDDTEAPSTNQRPQTVAPSKKQHGTTPSTSVQLSEESRSGRAATLRLTYVEPWSVTRMAFAISVALMIVSVVAVAIFWVVLDVTGVWDQIDGSVTSVLSDDSSSFRITDYLGFTRLVGLSLVLSALNVVIATVLATIAAHLYNLAAQLLGGFAMTFTSED